MAVIPCITFLPFMVLITVDVINDNQRYKRFIYTNAFYLAIMERGDNVNYF